MCSTVTLLITNHEDMHHLELVFLSSHGVSSGEDFKWGFIPANLTHLEAKVR